MTANYLVLQNYIQYLKSDGLSKQEIVRRLTNDFGYEQEYVESMLVDESDE